MTSDHYRMGDQPAERQTLTVEEAARVLGIGRSAAYIAARRGDLPAIRIGRRYVIPRVALERMLSEGRRDSSIRQSPSAAAVQ
jgi:excisionase family DNA binding protein